jgi:hypothetical protein
MLRLYLQLLIIDFYREEKDENCYFIRFFIIYNYEYFCW